MSVEPTKDGKNLLSQLKKNFQASGTMKFFQYIRQISLVRG